MKFKFLVADDIRMETTGKPLVFGLYADDILVTQAPPMLPAGLPKGTPAGIDQLSLLVNIAELPDGLHRFQGKLLKPSGEPYAQPFPWGEVEIKAGNSHNLIIQLKPFLLTEGGRYQLIVSIDDVEQEPLPFEVRITSSPQQALAENVLNNK
jgi:hypothetical protein